MEAFVGKVHGRRLESARDWVVRSIYRFAAAGDCSSS